MLEQSEALELAATFIEKVYPDKVGSLVLLPDNSVEYAFGWAIRFDWKEHIETGDWSLKPFTAVVIVPHSGERTHFPPTALPVDDYMSRRASGDWPSKE